MKNHVEAVSLVKRVHGSYAIKGNFTCGLFCIVYIRTVSYCWSHAFIQYMVRYVFFKYANTVNKYIVHYQNPCKPCKVYIYTTSNYMNYFWIHIFLSFAICSCWGSVSRWKVALLVIRGVSHPVLDCLYTHHHRILKTRIVHHGWSVGRGGGLDRNLSQN